MTRCAVLVVDDEISYTGVLREILASYGLDVLVAYHGDQALGMLESVQPNLIMLDMMMPGIDGLTLLNRVRRETALRDTPVIVVSANVVNQEKQKALSAGADAFLEKPFSAKELRAALRPFVEIPDTSELEKGLT
ncbi:MAG TPA: response regulator [Anaerolineales bacterium]|nr:response regulator [Anaerolineales bacterium]